MNPWHVSAEEASTVRRSPPEPAVGARPRALTPATALALQRSAGNRAVGALLARNEESAAKLQQLATPQVFQGPEVKLQLNLVKKLEKGVQKWSDFARVPCLFLGAIELGSIPEKPEGEEKMIKKAKLVDLPPKVPVEGGSPIGADPRSHAIQEGGNAYAMVKKLGLREDVVRNTLRTMSVAGQLDYLRKAGWVGKEWTILVEVHYYRDRPKDRHEFHKDTFGQTLFVNLNYHTNQDLMGPEYVINPPSSPEHDKQITGSLPPGFLGDLGQSRKALPAPTEIGMTPIPPNGVAAFVDEAIHHMTPQRGHRKVYGQDLELFLNTHHKQRFEAAKRADKGTGDTTDAAMWGRRVELSKDKHKPLTRVELLEAGLAPREIDELMATSGPAGYKRAVIPGVKTEPDVRGPGAPALERRASQLALENRLPPEPPDERRFFRTWVRAVKT